MSQLHIDHDQTPADGEPDAARQQKAPLINRLIDPSNVVFSLVFCQQARREFEGRQAG